jgi:pSer/pThr/pTyr-binding forkhead associated (FHA) protein
MALTIAVRSHESESPPGITLDAPRIVLGRGSSCDVRLPDRSVSHRHASIQQRGNEYIIVDEGSTNGTYVGPVRLSPHAPRVLVSGDLVRLGRVWLEVGIEHAPVATTSQVATKELALALVAQALTADGEDASLVASVTEGPDAGTTLVVSKFEHAYVLGRAKSCDLVLTDPDASRHHAEIVRRGAQLLVRDLGSKNGSRLGEAPLVRDKQKAWPPQSPLVIGSTQIVYVDPVSEALAELEQMADEHMDDDEWVQPPAATSARDGEDDAPAPAKPASHAPETAPAPPAKRRRAAKAQGAWNSTDLLVLLLALAVIAASLLGLFWLFGSS